MIRWFAHNEIAANFLMVGILLAGLYTVLAIAWAILCYVNRKDLMLLQVCLCLCLCLCEEGPHVAPGL